EIIATAPPTKVIPVGDAGLPIEPLRDDQPITELDSFKNLAEAKRGMKNFRDAQERGRQELLAALEAQAAEQQRAEQAAQEPPAPQPSPTPQPGPAKERGRWEQI